MNEYKKEDNKEDNKEVNKEENKNKEEKKEVKKKRKNTVNVPGKIKTSKNVIKEEGKAIVKLSKAKNLKDLLG